ncbi:hypothetical protein M413DRAFT_12376 [Hebeloma cylindrosporum]|uniref:Uncharacterized protein n=1 Tax=Hebeloma cylindrosporum TaxID=76867 RepID=A0A0C2XMZ4_HEBCY|nr:hypothetical protein M413DRAFT_12376 [Hebeloma cylindrosporum h7]
MSIDIAAAVLPRGGSEEMEQDCGSDQRKTSPCLGLANNGRTTSKYRPKLLLHSETMSCMQTTMPQFGTEATLDKRTTAKIDGVQQPREQDPEITLEGFSYAAFRNRTRKAGALWWKCVVTGQDTPRLFPPNPQAQTVNSVKPVRFSLPLFLLLATERLPSSRTGFRASSFLRLCVGQLDDFDTKALSGGVVDSHRVTGLSKRMLDKETKRQKMAYPRSSDATHLVFYG